MEVKKNFIAVCFAAGVSAASVHAFADEIVFPSFFWGNEWNNLYLSELKDAFEATHPGVTVEGINIPFAAFWDKQYADVTAGTPPDIVTLFDPEIRGYIEAGLLEPLDLYLEAAGYSLDDFQATAVLAEEDGHIYAVPNQLNPRALFYNKALLAEVGLEPPTDVDEFLAAVEALREPETQQFGFATASKPGNPSLMYIETTPIFVGFNGGFFNDGAPNVTSPAMIEALTLYKRLYDDRLIPRGVDTSTYREMFAQGKVAMYASGAFIAGAVELANQEIFEDLAAVPLPFPAGESMSITVFLAIPKGAPNKDAAAEFLMTMLEDQWQQRLVEIVKAYPARKGFVTDQFLAENPWFQAFETAARTASSYAPEGVEQYGPEIMKIIADHLENMLFNDVVPEKVAEELQVELEQFITAKKQ